MEAILPETGNQVKTRPGRSDTLDMGRKKMKLASWLVSHRLITIDQANDVMAEQGKQSGHIKDRFGRIAVKKGYISEAALNKACMDKEREEVSL
jgi:hypothetical protein